MPLIVPLFWQLPDDRIQTGSSSSHKWRVKSCRWRSTPAFTRSRHALGRRPRITQHVCRVLLVRSESRLLDAREGASRAKRASPAPTRDGTPPNRDSTRFLLPLLLDRHERTCRPLL